MARCFALLLLLAAPLPAAEPKAGEFADETVKVGDATRHYRLFVPKSVDLTKPVPLVIAFHGMGIDSKDLMPKYTGLNDAADKHKFLIAYPNAIDRSWGLVPDKVKADLEFFDALTAKLAKDYKVDPERLYLAGMSNGAYFAHLVGKERSKTVAAVAAHSGSLGLQTLGGIKAERKFPVIIVHGDKDKLIPVETGRKDKEKYEKEGHPVEYLELKGVGHAWGDPKDVNEAIWKFLDAHPLDGKK